VCQVLAVKIWKYGVGVGCSDNVDTKCHNRSSDAKVEIGQTLTDRFSTQKTAHYTIYTVISYL
jgi:hypothetical protein